MRACREISSKTEARLDDGADEEAAERGKRLQKRSREDSPSMQSVLLMNLRSCPAQDEAHVIAGKRKPMKSKQLI